MVINLKGKINTILDEILRVSLNEKVVVAFSGGVDSSVVLTLAGEALGKENVQAITVNFDEYSYRKGLENILRITERLDIELKIIDGKKVQEKVLKRGPACNRCTRIAKLGKVRSEAKGKLVLTGSNQSDTWGKRGLKVHDGFYAPLLDLTKKEIKEIANHFDLKILKIGESEFREGCKLKHLLKPLASTSYHGHTAAEANEILLNILEGAGCKIDLANVKIIGPLNKNIGLINIFPLPNEKIKETILQKLEKIETLEEVIFLEKPAKLIIKANKGQFDNYHSRYWLEKGRLQPDFSIPIEVEWLLTSNKNLATFQVIDYKII